LLTIGSIGRGLRVSGGRTGEARNWHEAVWLGALGRARGAAERRGIGGLEGE